MAYKVVTSIQADAHLEWILEDDTLYTPARRLAYYDELVDRIASLSTMPERFVQVTVGDNFYRKMSHKAHAIYYRVDAERMKVTVIAILNHRQLPSMHLS